MHAKPGYELLLQAFGGPMSITGELEGNPVRCGPSINDLGTGNVGRHRGILSAIATAWYYRTGLSGADFLVRNGALLDRNSSGNHLLHPGETPKRHGAGHPSVVPYQIFQTKTGPLIVAAGNDRLFSKLANVLGKPEMGERSANTPARNSARVVNRSTLEESLRAILAIRAKEEWVAEFEVAGIPCGAGS